MKQALVRLGAAVIPPLAGLTFGAASLASPSGTAGHSVQIVHLVAMTTEQNFLDLGDTGLSLGDQFVFHDALLRNGTRIGADGGVCSVISPTSGMFQCAVTFSLPSGRIAAQGLIAHSPGTNAAFVFAVTGGTGSYSKVAGEVKMVQSTNESALVTLRLAQ
jgi:hypothetical protein